MCWAVIDMLAFENVTRLFHGCTGVTDLTFKVEPGEIVALIGLNGAGKTTLMRLALGVLRPQSGRIEILDHLLKQLPPARWAQVGALIEVPLAYPELTVRQNLRIACLLNQVDPERVEESVTAWNLDPVSNRRFSRLSLGNKQRVGLAASMQHDPRVIVLDEPSNSLDPATVLLLREQLKLRAQGGAAILVSSHHLDEVARIADRILLMNAGRLIGELTTTGNDLEREFFEQIRRDDALCKSKEEPR